ncbi:hypothetical protein D3C84_519980 [compost metagenome]
MRETSIRSIFQHFGNHLRLAIVTVSQRPPAGRTARIITSLGFDSALITGGWHQGKAVAASTKVGLEKHRRCDFATIEQQVARPAAIADKAIEVAINQGTQHAKEGDQVALACAIGTDNHVKAFELKLLQCLNGFEPPYGQMAQCGAHGWTIWHVTLLRYT